MGGREEERERNLEQELYKGRKREKERKKKL